MDRVDILSLTYEELNSSLMSKGLKPFRVTQLYDWLHKKRVASFEGMSNISKDTRKMLDSNYFIKEIKVIKEQVDREDFTRKLLFKLEDNELIETVIMKYKDHYSVCLSTQAGCAMGCTFCASGINGLARNLTTSEILRQFYICNDIVGEKISHIVFMGTGEPLHNYDNVVKSIQTFCNEKGQNLSVRNITLSTCGIVPRIYELADLKLGITLALSLHATTNEKRKTTMPITNRFGIDECLNALAYYFSKTKRRISFEYALIKGVNDSMEEAVRLVKLLKGRDFLCHVNLIPVNEVKERDFVRPNARDVYRFAVVLEREGIDVTIRRSVGGNIDAACGQLRLKEL